MALPDKPSVIGLIDSDKGNLVDVLNKKFVRSIPGWDGSHTRDGKYGLVAPPSGGMDILDLRTGTELCTANEGPVRIQYKCLVPISVFPEMKLLFPKQNYNVLSPQFPQLLHSYICERFIYFQDRSANSVERKYVDRS